MIPHFVLSNDICVILIDTYPFLHFFANSMNLEQPCKKVEEQERIQINLLSVIRYTS